MLLCERPLAVVAPIWNLGIASYRIDCVMRVCVCVCPTMQEQFNLSIRSCDRVIDQLVAWSLEGVAARAGVAVGVAAGTGTMAAGIELRMMGGWMIVGVVGGCLATCLSRWVSSTTGLRKRLEHGGNICLEIPGMIELSSACMSRSMLGHGGSRWSIVRV